MQRVNLETQQVVVNTGRIQRNSVRKYNPEGCIQTSFTPNHALMLKAIGGSSFGRSRSPMSTTTRNIFNARGRSSAV